MSTPVTNFGKVIVGMGYNSSATSIVLSTGHGSRLPSTFPFPLVWWNATDYPDPADDPDKEIISVTARNTDTLTIVRAQEGTIAANKNIGGKTYKMVLGITKAMWESLTVMTQQVNLLRNTQWQIRTALGMITKFNKEGTGTLPLISVTSYSVGTNQPVFVTSNTSQLKVGDVVKFSGADANVNLSGVEVSDVTLNTSFTGFLAQGKQSIASTACTAQIVSRGDVTGSMGAGPDPWQKTIALTLWIDDNVENVKPGSKVQVGVQQTAAAAQVFNYSFLQKNSTSNTSFDDIAPLLGRTLVFGSWINYKVRSGSGTYRVFILTDTGYTYGPSVGTTGYVWSEISATIPSTSTFVKVGIEFNGSVNDTFYISQPMLAFGSSLGEGNYSKSITGSIFTPTVKFSPFAWENASLSFPASLTDGVYPWTYRMKAETLEAVSNDIIAAYTEAEGANGIAGHALAFMATTTAPQLDGPIIYAQVGGVKMAAYSWWWLTGAGTARVYSIHPSDSWTNVSIDFSAYILS